MMVYCGQHHIQNGDMAAPTLFIGLALFILAAQCAVLKDQDPNHKRIPRSPCDSCDQIRGPPPPPDFPPPPPPPPPPPYFRSQQWSGLSRGQNGRPQGIFSGAAASLSDERQNAGQAFSIASSSAGSSNGQSGLGQNSGSNYRQSQYALNAHGGKSFGSGSVGSSVHQVGNFDGNDQQQQQQSGFGGSGATSSAQSASYAGNGGNAGFNNAGGNAQHGSSFGLRGDQGEQQQIQQQSGFSNQHQSGFEGSGAALNSQSSAYTGNGGNGGVPHAGGANYGSSFGARGDQGNEQQHVQTNGYHSQGGSDYVGSSHGSGYRAASQAQSAALSSHGQGNANEQQQVQQFGHGSSWKEEGGYGGGAANSGASAGSSSNGANGQETLGGALNLASQGLQAAHQTSGCSTCGKSSYALSNAKSHSGSAVALSIGG